MHGTLCGRYYQVGRCKKCVICQEYEVEAKIERSGRVSEERLPRTARTNERRFSSLVEFKSYAVLIERVWVKEVRRISRGQHSCPCPGPQNSAYSRTKEDR